VASQWLATLTGSDPPVTKPKKRPPALAIVAGDPISSSVLSVSIAGCGPAGKGSSSWASRASACGCGATARASRASR
jgi:hypothetical protein